MRKCCSIGTGRATTRSTKGYGGEVEIDGEGIAPGPPCKRCQEEQCAHRCCKYPGAHHHGEFS